jgi:hypothetical protein
MTVRIEELVIGLIIQEVRNLWPAYTYTMSQEERTQLEATVIRVRAFLQRHQTLGSALCECPELTEIVQRVCPTARPTRVSQVIPSGMIWRAGDLDAIKEALVIRKLLNATC